jgi:hypothetical protein
LRDRLPSTVRSERLHQTARTCSARRRNGISVQGLVLRFQPPHA